jgi:hypothetical protein
MVNLDAMQRYTLDHQRELLDEAARRRLIYGSAAPPATRSPARSLRGRVATVLRHTADRLEPAPSLPRVGVLRAVAHREISVDQAMRLLEANGH